MGRDRVRVGRWWALLFVPLVFVLGFVVWAKWTPGPMVEAQVALDAPSGTDGVLATQDRWLTFRPVSPAPSTGLILYPGARVPAAAYGPAARAIAARGYLVVIAPMPLNLAVLAPARAASVMASHPEVAVWAVGGHSMGGAMAARFAYRNPGAVAGLVLWASYPARSDDLSDRDLAVSSIYGTRDGLATPDEIAASRPLLPSDAEFVAVEGGNHAQFGWYGPQSGDNRATISRDGQQRQVTAATVALLERGEP